MCMAMVGTAVLIGVVVATDDCGRDVLKSEIMNFILDLGCGGCVDVFLSRLVVVAGDKEGGDVVCLALLVVVAGVEDGGTGVRVDM